MRIYSREAFLQLPAGTFYCTGPQWAFGGLCVKGDSWPNDFLLVNIQTIESRSSEQLWARYDQMLTEGVSFPLNAGSQRDAAFADEDVFLVYEPADLQQLIVLCEQAIQAHARQTAPGA